MKNIHKTFHKLVKTTDGKYTMVLGPVTKGLVTDHFLNFSVLVDIRNIIGHDDFEIYPEVQDDEVQWWNIVTIHRI